jgi:Glutathione S-transferase, N-terminal domain
MPKPDLTALTGGYRKTPVLQIGADIYCDSQLIMRELERRYPSRAFIRPAVARPMRLPGGPRRQCSSRPSALFSRRDPKSLLSG